jgi:N-acylneuraminate cytidylyltransferase
VTSVVALVPARAGSKRVPGKNLRDLEGHPLLAYSVAAALQSEVFDRVLVSTDDPHTARIAQAYGAEVLGLRPPELAADLSPDVEWVHHVLGQLTALGQRPDVFSILRPTSPLRTPATVRRAVQQLVDDPAADSLRAVELVSQHPGKMWVREAEGARMRPLLDDGGADPPWHSSPYQALPQVYVQNASLEVARTRCIDDYGTIAGRVVQPFVLPGLEGFDLNTERDWLLLQSLLASGDAGPLPAVHTTGPLPDHEDCTCPT